MFDAARRLAYAMARLGHYTSTYCIDGNHEKCRVFCKNCGRLCRCPRCRHGALEAEEVDS